MTQRSNHTPLRAAFDAIAAPGDKCRAYRIDRNVDAFASRWKTLAAARSSFDTTYFIWEKDVFGFAFLGHLLKKARDGVAVRGMFDAFGDPLGKHGFKGSGRGQDYLQELVGVDPARVRFGVFYPLYKKRPSSLKRLLVSNHDKLAIADRNVVETGGRNMSRHYFSDPLDLDRVFLDTDIHVESEVVAASATAAFDAEYDESFVQFIKPDRFGNWIRRDLVLLGAYLMMDEWLRAPTMSSEEKNQVRGDDSGRSSRAAAVIEGVLHALPGVGVDRRPLDRELKVLKALAEELVDNVELRGAARLEPRWFDGEVKIVDNVSTFSGGERRIGGALRSLIAAAARSIYIHNPYVVLSDDAIDTLAEAGRRGVEIVFGTNSPLSSDSALTQAFFLDDWPSILARVPNARFLAAAGAQRHHSKTFVVDGVLTGISSFNADWLSEQVNSEVVTLHWSSAFAADTVAGYRRGIDDEVQAFVEYSVARNDDGRALVRDGEPVVAFGPEDHVPEEVLSKKFALLRPALRFARRILPSLRPLRHRALDPGLDPIQVVA